jgi:hypothetical protein
LDAGRVHRALALSHFLLAVAACLVLYMVPVAGLWPILLSIIPFGARLWMDRPLFHNGWIDGLLIVFLVTALIGYWAAYDQTAAWMKLSLLIAGILLYYAISTQPESNLGILAGFWFIFGLAVAIYFLLTLDLGASPAKFQIINQIGLRWMSIRPAVSWPAIQPTDTAAGIAIVTSVYGLYFLVPHVEMHRNNLVRLLVLLGYGIVLAAVVLATSRGALVALAAAIGVWLVRLAVGHIGWWKENGFKFLPAGVLMFIGLTALLLILPLGLFGTGFLIGENLIINRSELIRNGISIMLDFPLLGGGLNSFPGLFSQYVLVVPYYSLLNSHNLFVDVSIEQGMVGGLAFLLLYSISIWKIASILGHKHPKRVQIFYGAVFASIFIALVHGLVDDYLYTGWWAALAFFPVGMSTLAIGTEPIAAGSLSENNSGWNIPIYSRGISFLVAAVVIAGVGLVWNKLAAQWFANLGAVEMAKVELAGYPANQWDDGSRNNNLQSAKILFVRSLKYNDMNRIANYHLGLIEMSERDFFSASNHLIKAYQQEPWHRGVIKNLGYSYVWLREIDKARMYLERIPEAKSELNVYVWWWDTQDRHDLSTDASQLAATMKNTIDEP